MSKKCSTFANEMKKTTKIVIYTILTIIVIFALIRILFMAYCFWQAIHI